MSKRDEALRMLREGVDLKVIETRTSRGTLYNAYMDFFAEADAKRKKTAEELENLEAVHKKTSAAVAGLERSEEEKRKAVEELERKAEKLGRDIKAAEEKLGDLKQTLGKYREDGVTEKTFRILSQVKIGDEEEFVERVKTYEAAQKLKNENMAETQSLLLTVNTKRNLQKTINKLEDEARNLELTLDEKKRMNIAWDDQHRLVEGFVKSGYTTDVLRSVKKVLDTHAIKKTPS
jgi:chromosome segregation ATPase